MVEDDNARGHFERVKNVASVGVNLGNGGDFGRVGCTRKLPRYVMGIIPWLRMARPVGLEPTTF
jgi:hypothetical protein